MADENDPEQGKMENLGIWGVIATGLIGLLGGGFLGTFAQAWVMLRKAQTEAKKADAQLPVDQLNQFVETLQKRIGQLEKDHADCVSDHKDTIHKLGRLEGMIEEQRDRMKYLQEANIQANRDAIKAQAHVAAVALKDVVTRETLAAAAASDPNLKLPQVVDEEHPMPVKIVPEEKNDVERE